MLVIRFFRVGKKNQPSFKIIVTDKRRPPRGGHFLEEVGFWNPLTKEKVLKEERIKYWLSKGAKPSNSVYNLLISEKILEGKKIPVHKKKKEKKETPKHPAAAGPTGQASVKKPPQVPKPEKEEVKKEEGKKEEKPPLPEAKEEGKKEELPKT